MDINRYLGDAGPRSVAGRRGLVVWFKGLYGLQCQRRSACQSLLPLCGEVEAMFVETCCHFVGKWKQGGVGGYMFAETMLSFRNVEVDCEERLD